MPWRETSDPYHILVSEMMLQQTQVARVLPKYTQFIRRFPTVHALDRAELRDVLDAWQGLGYNRRALFLKRLAREVAEQYDGNLPSDREKLKALPGIGDATSGALCAFAFNTPVVFIETNIRSVYIHHFFADRAAVSDDEILPYVERTLDLRKPREWYYALMDYGVHLKSIMPNPSRKSRHYAKQSPFKGSDRELRGRILRILTAGGPLRAAALAARLRETDTRVARTVRTLLKDGLIRRRGSRLTV